MQVHLNTDLKNNKHTVGSPYSQVFHLQIQPTVDRQLYFQPMAGIPQR